jgi:hypothetical protein
LVQRLLTADGADGDVAGNVSVETRISRKRNRRDLADRSDRGGLVEWFFVLTATAYNLVRIPKLLATG